MNNIGLWLFWLIPYDISFIGMVKKKKKNNKENVVGIDLWKTHHAGSVRDPVRTHTHTQG